MSGAATARGPGSGRDSAQGRQGRLRRMVLGANRDTDRGGPRDDEGTPIIPARRARGFTEGRGGGANLLCGQDTTTRNPAIRWALRFPQCHPSPSYPWVPYSRSLISQW